MGTTTDKLEQSRHKRKNTIEQRSYDFIRSKFVSTFLKEIEELKY